MDFTLGGAESSDVAYMLDPERSKATEMVWEGPLDTYHYIVIELVFYGFGTLKIISVMNHIDPRGSHETLN